MWGWAWAMPTAWVLSAAPGNTHWGGEGGRGVSCWLLSPSQPRCFSSLLQLVVVPQWEGIMEWFGLEGVSNLSQCQPTAPTVQPGLGCSQGWEGSEVKELGKP